MRILYILAISLIFSFEAGIIRAQDDTTQVTTTPEDTTASTETDPVKQQIVQIIKEVNSRASFVDNIISEGDIKVKTPKIDESGSIEIHEKKKDDVWFDITGT